LFAGFGVLLPGDMGELLLHGTGGGTGSLVVDRWPKLAHEEIQKALSTEVAQHFVEVIGEVLLERSYEVCASFVGQPDPHGRFVFVFGHVGQARV
jgi:hypothetical protein